jgi:hypothetical protein
LQELFNPALLATLDALEEAIVSRLLLELVVPQESSALAREGAGDPAEDVGDAPDGHADAPLDGETAPGHGLECVCLNLKLGGSGGGVHADVKLGVHNVDVQSSETAKNSLEASLAGQGTGGRGGFLGKVGLVKNMVRMNVNTKLQGLLTWRPTPSMCTP